jgi:hypothetical protein
MPKSLSRENNVKKCLEKNLLDVVEESLKNILMCNLNRYIHAYIPLTFYTRRGNRGITDIPPSTFYQNCLAMRNTVEVTGVKPIAV